MTIAGIVVIIVILAMLAALLFTRIPPDALLVATVTVLLLVPVPSPDSADNGAWQMGVMSIEDGLSGMSNPGMITVGVLFVVVVGLRETGAIDWLAGSVLGQPKGLRRAMISIAGPVTFLSAFLNNTPVVAMMIPAIQEWGRKINLPPSKLMIPLSYAAILGGMCSLIGTSTNLVVAGLVVAETDMSVPGIFSVTWVGLPAAIIGLVYLLTLGPKLLPSNQSVAEAFSDPREYTIEMIVPEGSSLNNKTVEQAGLRQLPNMFVVEIDRGDRSISPVGPNETLRIGDRLVFAGVVESVRDLQNIRGLIPANEAIFELDSPRHHRKMFEVVVSNTCPVIGKSIREAGFRSKYQAAIIAVARNGKRITSKIGDIRLRPGDTLLIEAGEAFLEQNRNSRDFFLVTDVADSRPRRSHKAPIAVGILTAMVFFAAMGWLNMLLAAMVASGFMILTRCCTIRDARSSVDWSVLIVIAAALGIGRALYVTGAAGAIADGLLSVAGSNPMLALIALYIATNLMTETITNNAAVALTFPIALQTSLALDVNLEPFIFAIMIAGSASFATPFGYQTNLMVYGPGGYRFADYLKIGIPLNILIAITALILCPLIWPF